MKTTVRLQIAMLVGPVLIVAGCASTPTIGDQMSKHGQATKKLGSNWSRGDALLKKGLKLQEESAALAKKSNKKRQEAEELVSEGKRLQRESEIAFQDQFDVTNR
jgi:hypothetical protein